MQLSQLTQMIGLLTEIRDCLTAQRIDQRVSAVQIIESMAIREREREIHRPRTPFPKPPSPDRVFLPEEHVERSRGRYPAFPLRPSKSHSQA